MEKKKKGSNYIIPPSFFKIGTEVTKPQPEKTTTSTPSAVNTQEATTPPPKEKKVETPVINTSAAVKNRVSGLSLSSIKRKREHELQAKKNHAVDEKNLPKDPFDEQTMQKHWEDYVDQIEKDGKKILASALGSDTPRLKGPDKIWIELANDTLKKEVERDQYPLMEYLKKNLNNFHIELYITINENAEKQYAFTPQDKYEKLREKNPLIDKLRIEFDLDV